VSSEFFLVMDFTEVWVLDRLAFLWRVGDNCSGLTCGRGGGGCCAVAEGRNNGALVDAYELAG
jgi:hypothetical protein